MTDVTNICRVASEMSYVVFPHYGVRANLMCAKSRFAKIECARKRCAKFRLAQKPYDLR